MGAFWWGGTTVTGYEITEKGEAFLLKLEKSER